MELFSLPPTSNQISLFLEIPDTFYQNWDPVSHLHILSPYSILFFLVELSTFDIISFYKSLFITCDLLFVPH